MNKVYFDSGVFWDFIVLEKIKRKNIYQEFLFKNILKEIKKKRRERSNRSLSKIHNDAKTIFEKAKNKKIAGYTSVLTLIELTDRIFKTSRKVFKGKDGIENMSIKLVKDSCRNFNFLIKIYNINLLGIKKDMLPLIDNELKTKDLQIKDCLHLILAKENNCDILCTTDKDLHKLGYVRNKKNKKMFCIDTDDALKKI